MTSEQARDRAEDAALDEFSELVEASRVSVVDGAEGEPRVALPQTVSAYARDARPGAGEPEDACRRHTEHYLAVLEEVAPGLRSTHPLASRDRIESELDNIRAALA